MSGPFLYDAWYQAGWSEEIAGETMLARTFLDTPIVLFRDSDGEVGALHDRCVHRFAPLSLGRFDGESLTCGYHGLQFDRTGRCIHNPHGARAPGARVQAFPVAERNGAVWIWFGDAGKADPALIPDLGCIDATPATARAYGHMMVEANWQLVGDNLIDLSHADYLHPDFGGFLTDAKTTIEESPTAMRVLWYGADVEPRAVFRQNVPEGNADILTQLDWTVPASFLIEAWATPTGVPPRNCTNWSVNNLTPQSAASTHYFYCFTRDFRTDDTELTAITKAVAERAFSTEDKPMLAAQQSRIGTADFMALRPALLPSDTAAVRARRKLDQLMQAAGEAMAG